MHEPHKAVTSDAAKQEVRMVLWFKYSASMLVLQVQIPLLEGEGGEEGGGKKKRVKCLFLWRDKKVELVKSNSSTDTILLD